MQTIPRLVATAVAVGVLATIAPARAQDAEKAAGAEKLGVHQYRVVKPDPLGVLVTPNDPADPKTPAPRATFRARIALPARPFAIPEIPATDPHRPVVERVRAVLRAECATCHAGGVAVQRDELLGLAVVPADETLRAQLGLKDKGLVVTTVPPYSAGAAAGVKEKDIVVRVGDKDISTVDDLKASLAVRTHGGDVPEEAKPAVPRSVPFAIALIRAGEPKEVRIESISPTSLVVGPPHTIATPVQKAPSYWIGVALGEADETLRSHLKLGKGVGVVVTDVIDASPARKAGLKKNDVLLAVGEKPLKDPQDLIRIVQEAKDATSLAIRYRRDRSEATAEVRPEARKDPNVAATGPAPLPAGPTQTWVRDLVPFLDNNGPDSRTWLFVQPGTGTGTGTLPAPIERRNTLIYNIEPAKPIEVTLRGEIEQLLAQFKAAEASQKAREAKAASSTSLDRVEGQLKALEAQLRELKKSMDDLKGSLKKE